MSNTSFILSDSTFTLYYDSKVHFCSATHPKWAEVCQLAKENKWDEIVELITPIAAVALFIEGTDVRIDGNHLYYKDELLHGTLVQRILDMRSEGFNVTPMVKFLVNLQENPSYRSRQQLYTFLEKNNLPITEHGYFIAFKRIRDNYYDVHSSSFDNHPGQTVEMPRYNVDDDPNNTCSSGLHVCSREYLQHFTGDRVVSVQVNPRDVVSVPTDYDFTKMRVCRYEVLEELDMSILNITPHHLTSSVYSTSRHWEEEQEDETSEDADIEYNDDQDDFGLR